jgi:hypothetical protein
MGFLGPGIFFIIDLHYVIICTSTWIDRSWRGSSTRISATRGMWNGAGTLSKSCCRGVRSFGSFIFTFIIIWLIILFIWLADYPFYWLNDYPFYLTDYPFYLTDRLSFLLTEWLSFLFDWPIILFIIWLIILFIDWPIILFIWLYSFIE